MLRRRQKNLFDGTNERDARAWRAVVALRIELLRTATNYGVSLARPEDVPEWRRWIRWLEKSLAHGPEVGSYSLRELTPYAKAARITEWFDQLRARLDDVESDTSPERADATLVSAGEFWLESLERLAERAREIEELGGQPLGEEKGRESSAGVALLGGLEDSLVLALSDTEANRAQRLTAHDVYDLIKTAERQGVWGALSAT